MIKFYDYILTLIKPIIMFVGKFGMPKRKITGQDYYELRDEIEEGCVFLTKTNYELSNLINPTELKHAGIYVGNLGSGKVCYVLEATGSGAVITPLASFMMTKDILVACKPNFIRDRASFNYELHETARRFKGIPYDYLFNKDGKAFYCFELAAMALKSVYSEINFQCKEIVKGKKIFSEETFLDSNFFDVIFDSRNR